ncbi:pleckstrin homology domain-containing family g member 5-like [Plakobranchus ocellatus]|uniref:Pleckstrin homology domain-containing family g member 5-like n=1 Tax=Plakobranchus ocellatus TaxID=259542 RepID=A0AAV3ZP56_9GAST|nr:pleckstrin homology domain-containing family g member 5-like [Plakobranchus ocellatus]
MQRSEAVRRRVVRSTANPLNRRSWPLAPGPVRQQLRDKERQDQLGELLNRYSAQGLPPLPELLALGRPKFSDANAVDLDLEPHWNSFVDNTNMTKKQQEHQEAVWELLHTEVSYIRQIRVIIDVFQTCLINVQQEGFLNEIETERLFSNIDKIFECNSLFWQEYLLPVLAKSRETGQSLDPLLAREGFVDHFPILFQVYFKYCIEHKSCLEYAKLKMDTSDLFKTFILWAEAQRQCNRLKLADILVKPMQRLLKYSLLLQAILKHTESEVEAAAIREMIESVEKLCWAANTSLQRREDYEKLEAVRKTIDLYDAIEAPNDECAKIIQEYNGNFNLLAPMPGFREGQPRSLLSHSSLRMKEAQAAKVDVDCLLFTDLILICKSNKKMDRFKIIRPPMRLDQLVVSELRDKGAFLLIYMNEYHVPISAFTFHSDVAGVRAWLERFREAQKDFKLKKIQESAELERIRSGAAQEEVHYTPVISVPSDLDLSSSSGFPRSESMESADRFIPNLLLSPQCLEADKSPTEIGRSGSTGDIYNQQFARPVSNSPGFASTSNLTTAAGTFFPLPPSMSSLPSSSAQTSLSSGFYTDSSPPPPRLPSERTMSVGSGVPKSSPSSSSSLTSGPQGTANIHKPIQPCRSVPNITVGAESSSAVPTASPSGTTSSSQALSPKRIAQSNTNRDANVDSHHRRQHQQYGQLGYDPSSPSIHFSFPSSASTMDQEAYGNENMCTSQAPMGSWGDQNSGIDENELSRLKLVSRRTSRAEKRYHTADSITDIKSSHEKDSSIHKRLSWRTDVQVVGNKNLSSPNKAVSTDSVRSYPSSSGVSSTGSLHLNLESDISEESEVAGFGGNIEADPNSPTRRRGMFTVGDSADPQISGNTEDGHFDGDNSNEFQESSDYIKNEEEEEEDCALSDSADTQSKSTSDLVTKFNKTVKISEMENGIASVAVPQEGFNWRLTHADILKMKKLKHQVLFDANVESSEV